MTTLLSGTVQPPFLTLLSTTSQPALSPLFSPHTDPLYPDTSLIITCPDTSTDSSSSSSRQVPKHSARGSLAHPIVHIQSPSLSGTYIQAGCSRTTYDRRREKGKGRAASVLPLGIELPWMSIQLRGLGKRGFSIEVGIVDQRGREGVVRCSTFKRSPETHPYRSPPLLHLPLLLPTSAPSSRLTLWLDISLNFEALLPLFQTLHRPPESATVTSDDADVPPPAKKRRRAVELPSGHFKSVSYVRVYANCRVRRIWFAAEGDRTLEGMGRGVKEEWGLYANEAEP